MSSDLIKKNIFKLSKTKNSFQFILIFFFLWEQIFNLYFYFAALPLLSFLLHDLSEVYFHILSIKSHPLFLTIGNLRTNKSFYQPESKRISWRLYTFSSAVSVFVYCSSNQRMLPSFILQWTVKYSMKTHLGDALIAAGHWFANSCLLFFF